MDEYDHPGPDTETEFGMTTILTIFAAALSLFVCMLSFSDFSEIGPDVGEIVTFDPQNGPRSWSQPGIPALYVASNAHSEQPRECILMPSVMAAHGGSLVIEAKELTRPPSYRVHWSGSRTDLNGRDCGGSADLSLKLVQLRALATVAGGFGASRGLGLF